MSPLRPLPGILVPLACLALISPPKPPIAGWGGPPVWLDAHSEGPPLSSGSPAIRPALGGDGRLLAIIYRVAAAFEPRACPRGCLPLPPVPPWPLAPPVVTALLPCFLVYDFDSGPFCAPPPRTSQPTAGNSPPPVAPLVPFALRARLSCGVSAAPPNAPAAGRWGRGRLPIPGVVRAMPPFARRPCCGCSSVMAQLGLSSASLASASRTSRTPRGRGCSCPGRARPTPGRTSASSRSPGSTTR